MPTRLTAGAPAATSCRRGANQISIQCDGAPGQRIQIDAERIYAEPRLGLP